jgi:YVTN family beta-propeller protein
MPETIRRRISRCALTLVASAAAFVAIAPAALGHNAYVANEGSNTVSVINTQTDTIVASIPVGNDPAGIAITPDSSRAYVTNFLAGNVSVINTQANAVVGAQIALPSSPNLIAITPDGSHAYVTNQFPPSVSVLDTQINAVVGAPIPVGSVPIGVAITPDGGRAYVANSGSANVSVIDTQTNSVVGSPIPVGADPTTIAMSPNGNRAYVARAPTPSPGAVAVIDTQTNTVVGGQIPVGLNPTGIAITPDGSRAYTANYYSNNVSVINLQTNTIIGSPIAVGPNPESIAITPDGSRAYVTNNGSNSVSAIDTQTNTVVGAPIVVGTSPGRLAITPNQPPKASIHAPAKGLKATLKAGGSSDPDGQIATYSFDFGDGKSAQTITPTAKHTYKKVALFTASLTVSDGEGCPGSLFTGQTAYCNGSSVASVTRKVATTRLGQLKRNAKNGTARLTVQVPGKGKLKLSGKGVIRQRSPAREATFAKAIKHKGAVKLRIKPKGKKARKLDRAGTVKVKVKVTFKPKGGDRNIQTRRVKLMKRR